MSSHAVKKGFALLGGAAVVGLGIACGSSGESVAAPATPTPGPVTSGQPTQPVAPGAPIQQGTGSGGQNTPGGPGGASGGGSAGGAAGGGAVGGG